ncbi:MAG TPA: hypothetical protein VHH36_00315 [Candidatus Thermoplasmatota archaeon]|nr:hypothetical protein [Candidatus Thermoplasmatota archaeon]
MRLPSWLVLASLLAGCAFPDPPGTEATPAAPTPPTDAGGTPAPCPHVADATSYPSNLVAPPRWRPGLWWNETMLDEAGVERGFALHEVLGCVEVRGAPAYDVRETFLEYGAPAGLPEQPRVRRVAYEVATLHEVWDVCGRDPPSEPCAGSRPTWSFPLAPGKTWTYLCCGDVLSAYRARVEPTRSETWRIVTTTEDGDPVSTWTYSPALGLFTLHEGSWWNGPGSRALAAHGHGEPPAPARAEPSVSQDASCIHPEARGSARTTPVRGAWRASPEGLVVRLSRAVEDPLVGSPWRDERGAHLAWNTSSGGLIVASRLGDPMQPPSLSWRPGRPLGFDDAAGAERWLREVLERFAFAGAEDADVEALVAGHAWEARYGQSLDGKGVGGAGGALHTAFPELTWGPLYDLPEVSVSEDDARRAAVAYHRCAVENRGFSPPGDDETRVAAGFAVRGESLAYRFVLPYTAPGERHCPPSERVYVDAVTGAIIGSEPTLCI